MDLRKATLVKRRTDNGYGEMKDDVPLGKHYLVDLSTLRRARMYNLDHHAHWKAEIVDSWPEGQYLFAELLKIEGYEP